MTAPMYTLLLLAVIFANLPFLTTRWELKVSFWEIKNNILGIKSIVLGD